MKYLFPILALALSVGCGGGAEQPADGAPAPDSIAVATVPPIDLSSHGLPLLLSPPDKRSPDGGEPAIVWKDETGTLEVKAGDHFGLVITEEPGDIPRLKAALDRDLLRKNTLLRETPDLLTYRSEFPDDASLVFMHFYQVIKAGDRAFVVQDTEGQPFNQQDIDRMLAAVSPKPPA